MLPRLSTNILFYLFISLSMVLSAEEQSTVSQEPGKKEALNTKEESDVSKKKTVPPSYKLSGTLTFISDYIDRGISQTMLQPAVQGEIDFVHQSGIYLKTWASNVDGTGNFLTNTSMEWDFYVGIKQKIAQTQINYDIGFEYYYYPGGEARISKRLSYNTVEYYVGLTYKSVEVKITQTLTDYFGINSDNPPINWNIRKPIKPNGHSYRSPYLEANYTWTMTPKWSALFHVGYQGITNYSGMSYVDWKVAINREFDWFIVSLEYTQTNAKKEFYNIPDDAFKPHRKWLGGALVVLNVYHNF